MGTTANYSLRYPAETDAPDGATQIQDLAEDVDTALETATATQFVLPAKARKATDEGRASTTTLANDTSLVLTGLVSGAIYQVTGVIFYDGGASGSAGNLKWKFTVPTSSSGSYSVPHMNETLQNALPLQQQWTDTVTAGTNGVGTGYFLLVSGILIPGANGSLQFQWAQDSSQATNTHILANSFLTARRIG
jgi:hypothetical protein